MENAVEQLAASNRRSYWTKSDVVRAFLKGNAAKKQELFDLSELDKRTQASLILPGIAAGADAFAHVHRDRELRRLHVVAARVMREWKEPQYGLHRRFGAFVAIPTNGKTEWRWFEVRYCSVAHLQMWRDMKEENKTRIEMTIAETDVILVLARERHAISVNSVYREAMRKIAEGRGA